MKKLMNYLMLSCRKATMLIEKKLLVKLSFKERVQLTMHKTMCDACTAYEKQSIELDRILHKHVIDHETADNVIENDNLKKQITSKL